MTDELILISQRTHITPANATPDTRSRLARFEQWQRERPWYDLDLAAYRDELLTTLAPSSVSAHLATVRGRYRAILRDPVRRDELYSLAGERLTALDQDSTPANRKAFVDELVTRIEHALDPKSAPVKTVTRQDRADSDQTRLTREQAGELMQAPGRDTLRGKRDTAIITLMLCTGIREGELRALDVPDLRRRLGGELALHVREGKGCKERLIPYGALSVAVAVAEQWLAAAGIEDGIVFRGIHRGGKVLSGRIGLRVLQRTVGSYPVVIEGRAVTVRPHDLRRTYARRLYEAGVSLVAIQQNLGHSDSKTTLKYIGILDASVRRPPSIYPMADFLKQGELI